MQIEEYASLVISLSICGLISPIKTFRGKIIDGRMRYLACRDAGILPRFEEWNGEESQILHFLLSMNLYRSHLTASQQAIMIVEAESQENQITQK